MAINLHTHGNADNLLAEVRAAIEAGNVPGWVIDGDAISPTDPLLVGRAKLRVSHSISTVLMGVEIIDRAAPRDGLLAAIEGRMVQTMGTHFRERYSVLTVSTNADDRFHEGLE